MKDSSFESLSSSKACAVEAIRKLQSGPLPRRRPRLCRVESGAGIAECARLGVGFAIRRSCVVAIFDEAVVQRLQADAENLRRARLHAAALLERRENQLTVGLRERRAER